MLLTCKNCQSDFVSSKRTRQFCSKRCSVQSRKNNTEYIQKLRKPKTIKEKELINCLYCNTQFLGNSTRKYCSTDCCNKDRLLNKGYLVPIFCKECGIQFKPIRSSTQFCSVSCSRKNKINNPDFLNKLSAGCQKRSQNPNYIQKLSDAAINRWNNKDFRDKMTEIFNSDDWVEKSSESYLTYDYIFPSGRIERIQGYENYAIDLLLKEHIEEDIIVNKKLIKDHIGIITYLDKDMKERRYIPDIYIISKHKIIEVKSEWTYNIQKDNNERKKQACLDKGIDFEFLIF